MLPTTAANKIFWIRSTVLDIPISAVALRWGSVFDPFQLVSFIYSFIPSLWGIVVDTGAG